jgi:hypothetical protein
MLDRHFQVVQTFAAPSSVSSGQCFFLRNIYLVKLGTTKLTGFYGTSFCIQK